MKVAMALGITMAAADNIKIMTKIQQASINKAISYFCSTVSL
jgi:hypothetical protein